VLSVAGVDGCRTGWVVARPGGAEVVVSFAEVIARLPPETVIALDMPIGLAAVHAAGGRDCDRLARRLLGPRRGASVFSPPPRGALGVRSLDEARARGWPATLQALNILPKIEAVDATMSPELQARVFETHPELAFLELNRGRALGRGKRTADGRAARWALLEEAGVVRPARPRQGESDDDLVDACALLWSASRIARDEAVRVPATPPHDDRGLRMEIWR
jgi:predicted RNase H-like nuclease